jgi:UDP-N-acetylmuramoylalanine-D-glutamate ligase
MQITIAIVAGLGLLGGAVWVFLRGARAAARAAVVDSRPAETEAQAHAHLEAQKSASDVLRASDDSLRKRVDELRARGRLGK